MAEHLCHQLRYETIFEDRLQLGGWNTEIGFEVFQVIEDQFNPVSSIKASLNSFEALLHSHSFYYLVETDLLKLIGKLLHLLYRETAVPLEVKFHNRCFDGNGSVHEDFLQSWDTESHIACSTTSQVECVQSHLGRWLTNRLGCDSAHIFTWVDK